MRLFRASDRAAAPAPEGGVAPRRWRAARSRALAGVTVLAAGLGLVGYFTAALGYEELRTVDLRFDVRGARQPPTDVAVVAVDDFTFNALRDPKNEGLPYQWPYTRKWHARIIDTLRRAGAAGIAYDIQFTEPSDDIEADNALIEAVARTPRVVLATKDVDRNGHTNVFGGDKTVRELGARAGLATFPTDQGGVIRRMWHTESKLETLAIAAVESVDRRQIAPSALGRGDTAWIDFAGPPRTIPTVSFSKVLQGKVDPSFFRGRIVVVGMSDAALQDVHPTSTSGSREMSGPEIQANAIETARHGFPLQPVPSWVAALLIVALAIIPAAAGLLRLWMAAAVIVLTAAAYVVAAQLAFNAGTIVPVTYPLGALAVSAVGAGAVAYFGASVERERVRDLFRRFVPEAVVDEALKQAGGGVRLGGVRREGTVLFSDLRGFTHFAEPLEPDAVIEVLNRYLTAMSDCILANGGTLVSYMGDGIMAVFGAPVEQPDHADRAVATAHAMLGRLREFNDWVESERLGDGFRMGIGVNSGPVMSGHVGSERRLEYTALGDTTNTAARLEAMTKDVPHQILIADSTRQRLANGDPQLVDVGELAVRGRRSAVRVWTLAEEAETAPAEAAVEDDVQA
jgi:adenylate cyclase